MNAVKYWSGGSVKKTYRKFQIIVRVRVRVWVRVRVRFLPFTLVRVWVGVRVRVRVRVRFLPFHFSKSTNRSDETLMKLYLIILLLL